MKQNTQGITPFRFPLPNDMPLMRVPAPKPPSNIIPLPSASPAESIFGAPIYVYSRKQAIEDGEQVDVSETAREAGITFPTFLTRTVWDAYVAVPPGVDCQDEKGRLWDLIWMTRFAIRKVQGDRAVVALYVRNQPSPAKPKLIKLIAKAAAMDLDDPRPSITIMLPADD